MRCETKVLVLLAAALSKFIWTLDRAAGDVAKPPLSRAFEMENEQVPATGFSLCPRPGGGGEPWRKRVLLSTWPGETDTHR